jgi:hypothetical protein
MNSTGSKKKIWMLTPRKLTSLSNSNNSKLSMTMALTMKMRRMVTTRYIKCEVEGQQQ